MFALVTEVHLLEERLVVSQTSCVFSELHAASFAGAVTL